MELYFCDERQTVFIYATKEDLRPYLRELETGISNAATIEDLSKLGMADIPLWLHASYSVDLYLGVISRKEIDAHTRETGVACNPVWTPFGGRPACESPATDVFALWSRGRDKLQRLWRELEEKDGR